MYILCYISSRIKIGFCKWILLFRQQQWRTSSAERMLSWGNIAWNSFWFLKWKRIPKQIYCIGILYSQTFLEGHYEIVIYSNVNTKSLMLVILLKVHRLAQKIHSCCSLSCFFLPTTRPHFRNSIDIRVYALRGTWLKVVSFKNLHIFLQKRFQC